MEMYTDVTMPQRPDYDREVYPYAVAELCYEKGMTQWTQVRLYYASAGFYYEEALGWVTNDDRGIRWRSYQASDAQWSEEKRYTGRLALTPGGREDGFYRIWSEQPLYGTGGGVFLTTGGITGRDWRGLENWLSGYLTGKGWMPFCPCLTPAGASATAVGIAPEPAVWLTGWVIGRIFAKQRRKSKKRLVGYSYDGVPLPSIPVVEGKPYAVIITSLTENGEAPEDAGVICVLSDLPMIVRNTDFAYGENYDYVTTQKYGATAYVYRIPETGGDTWEFHHEQYTFNNYVSIHKIYGDLIWSSHRIRGPGGIYRDGTEPEPLYEEVYE